MPDDEPAPSTATHPLRMVLAASFVPAFPLCVASAAISHSPVPAVGLAPLGVSAVTTLLLHLDKRTRLARDGDHDEEQHQQQQEEHRRDGEDGDEAQGKEKERWDAWFDAMSSSLALFGLDTALAASIMVVLVFTWIEATHDNAFHRRPGREYMLAAYATVPLLLSFFIHAFFALQAFVQGLALHGFVQYTAAQVLPSSCPNCDHSLRRELPTVPWLEYFRWQSTEQQEEEQEGLRTGESRGYGSRGEYAPVPIREEDRYRDDGAEGFEEPDAIDVFRTNQR